MISFCQWNFCCCWCYVQVFIKARLHAAFRQVVWSLLGKSRGRRHCSALLDTGPSDGTFLGRVTVAAQAIPPIPTRFSVAWSVCLSSVCHTRLNRSTDLDAILVPWRFLLDGISDSEGKEIWRQTPSHGILWPYYTEIRKSGEASGSRMHTRLQKSRSTTPTVDRWHHGLDWDEDQWSGCSSERSW